jgi:hypothetical protein
MAFVGQTSNYATGGSTTMTVTRSVTAGNYLLVVANAYDPVDISVAFATTSGTTSGWTEIAAADFYDTGDDVLQEAAYATASATGSVTVTVTFGGNAEERSVVLIELSGISGFDAAQYARSTSATGGTAGLSNANATATRVVHINCWGGGLATSTSPYTDGGALASGYHRTQYINETSIQNRTGAFGAGATQPIHITQFIFSETGGGGGGGLRRRGSLGLLGVGR